MGQTIMRTKIRIYSELIQLATFEERLDYLKIGGQIGVLTFGSSRYLNQDFYRSAEWKRLRNQIFVRDMGCDMAHEDYPIMGRYVVHHMNPITVEDIDKVTDFLFNPEYLITLDPDTHNAIHYGVDVKRPSPFVERRPNDMCPWRQS